MCDPTTKGMQKAVVLSTIENSYHGAGGLNGKKRNQEKTV